MANISFDGISVDINPLTTEHWYTSITLKMVTSRSIFEFTGSVAIALCNADGDILKIIEDTNVQLSGYGWGYNTKLFTPNYRKIKSEGIENGDYIIKPVFRVGDAGEWQPALPANGCVSYLNAQITDTEVRFTSPEVMFTLSQPVKPAVLNTPQTIYKGRNLNVELQINNTGNTEYNAQIGIALISTADETKKYNLTTAKVVAPFAETVMCRMSGIINVPTGEYRIAVYYDELNKEESTAFPTTLLTSEEVTTISVAPAPAPYNLALTEKIKMPTEIFNNKPFTITTSIKNTGGLFNHSLIVKILQQDGASSYYNYVTSLEPEAVEIGEGETVKTAMERTLSLPAGNNYAAILYLRVDGKSDTKLNNSYYGWFDFELKDLFTGVENKKTDKTPLILFPNPAHSELHIQTASEPENDIVEIIDLAGKTVLRQQSKQSKLTINISHLAKGLYMVKVGNAVQKLNIR